MLDYYLVSLFSILELYGPPANLWNGLSVPKGGHGI